MIKRLLLLIIFATIFAVFLGFFGFIHPALDTIANFRWHFSIILLFLALPAILFFDKRLPIALTIIALGGWVSCLMPFSQSYIQPQPELTGQPDSREYSLFNLNLYYANPEPEKFFSLIRRINPDILTLSELSKQWNRRLKILDKEYPYSYTCPEWTVIGGSVIFSKLPMTSKKGKCHSYASLALKDLLIEGKTITIGAVHLRWPWPASGPRQVDELEMELAKLGKDALVAGDFNSTKWTWLVRRFADYGDLKIIRYTGASWMYRALPAVLAKWFGLSIDNAMVKGDIIITNAQSLKPVGSDHLPLLIRFRIN